MSQVQSRPRGRSGRWLAFAFVGAVFLGATAGLVLKRHGEPIASEPSPTSSLAPAPMPSASSVDTLYSVADGVTVSEYLPAAQPATQEVWDRVGSGWVLAAFEGGLTASGEDPGVGRVIDSYQDDTTTGPRVVYLVSPEGEVFEAANLTALGVDNLLGWSVDRGTALVGVGKAPQTPFDAPVYVLDLETGTLSAGVVPCPDQPGRFSADPVDGGWRIAGTCSGLDTGVEFETFIDDDAREIVSPWAPAQFPGDHYYRVVAGGNMIEMVGGTLGKEAAKSGESRLQLTAPGGSPRDVALPAAPDGGTGVSCAPFASGSDVMLVCDLWVGSMDEGTVKIYEHVSTIDVETATLNPVLDWFTYSAFAMEGGLGWSFTCIADSTIYGEGSPYVYTDDTTQPPSVDFGLWRWDATGPTQMPDHPGTNPELACLGNAGDRLIVRGPGSLLAFDPATQAWQTLLPVADVPADETGPRYVAGIRSLPVFIAP